MIIGIQVRAMMGSVLGGRARGVWTSRAARLSPLFTRHGSASYSYS